MTQLVAKTTDQRIFLQGTWEQFKLIQQASANSPGVRISPLLALMRNQIAAAARIKVKAATINSSNTDEWERVKEELLANESIFC